MSARENITVLFKPSPPPNLTKETLGVWTGWTCKGDREVAREAAAKGIHIELVKTFLAKRKKVQVEDAAEWFRKEVFLWVDELLSRKQIFRASHVLNNINLAPNKELAKVFYTTTKKELREYIGNHLTKIEELEDRLKQLWHLLDLVLKNNLLIAKYKLPEDSIECLDKQTDQWKYEIAAKLFLRTNDTQLSPFLNAEVLWKQLLTYNDLKLLTGWINIKYNDSMTESYGIPDIFVQIFKTLDVYNEMLNMLDDDDVAASTRMVVLNEFSKFGIFSQTDIDSFLNILKRLNNWDSILNINEIITKGTSNINIETYVNLLIEYCLDKNLYHVLNVCLKDLRIPENYLKNNYIHLSLIESFRKLVNELDENTLRDNIFKVSQFLCEDLIRYFRKNPLVFISLIFFTKNEQFLNIITRKSFTLFDIELDDAVPNMLQKLPMVQAVFMKKLQPICNNITFYDLLNRHLNVDVTNIFSFQFSDASMPHFNAPDIVKNFGYSKQVNYLFYIKQSRPSIASKLFFVEQFKNHGSIKQDHVKVVIRKVYKLAILNFFCTETTMSCIAFLEMIGVTSNFLRVCIHAANLLLESGEDVEQIRVLFLNVENDPFTIQNLLETTVMNSIQSNPLFNGHQLVDALKKYEVVVKFSVLYNLKLPELFLMYCASNNLWLPFLIHAQLKNYPIEQIKLTLQSMKNPNLLEHINHSVIHDIQVDEQNVLMRERDSRKYFLSRIGVRKSIDSLNQNTDSIYSSITSQSSYGSANSSSGSDFLEIDILNTKATLVQTLIRCHNSTDPPRALLQACQLYRNPLLAIIATSYEPDSVITNWLTWLAVSSELYETFTNFESISICAKSVTALLDNCMRNQFCTVILQSFEIFIPNNPLKPLMEFLHCCIYKTFELNTLMIKLGLFEKLLRKTRRNSVIAETDHEMNYLNNKMWIESTALLLLASAVEFNCKSLYEKILFLDAICKVNLASYFSIDCPNFQNLLRILNIVYECKISVNFNLIEAFDMKNNRRTVIDCINKLLDHEMFDSALSIAQIENLPLDLILVKEWQHKFESRDRTDVNFWPTCNETLKNYDVMADCVIEFYLDCMDKLQNNLEKYQLLKFSHEWASKYELSNRFELEKKMWLAYVTLEDKHKNIHNLKETHDNFLYKEMLELLNDISVYDDVEAEYSAGLEKVLMEALNQGNFWLALRLEKMFRCSHTDLDILKLCYSLAEGIIMPYQLNTQQRLLLSRGANFRRLNHRKAFLSARLSSLSSASHSPAMSSFMQTGDGIEVPMQDTLALLYSLTEKQSNGIELAHKIFMTYRISINIEIPYHVVVSNTDHMKMLKDALEDDCMNKLEVVHDFMAVYKWSKDQTADFVCQELVHAASHYIKSKTDNFIMWDVNIEQDFQLVLQLLHDGCSVLGYKIYSYASALYRAQAEANVDFKISELALVVVLLIAAHDCFTADCNMEGISIILTKCQNVISNLLTLHSWKLIVKLLTGVGRYTEMNYVFQILKENDQFEFLLRKGSRKDNGLKVALLEYLKKYCPDNRELYKLVALHFALFSEVAQLWEREAQSVIRNLIAISKLEMQNNKLNSDVELYVLFSNSDGTRICLNKAIENYTHATEFHLQGEKLAKAMNAAKQAELIALQLSLLKGLPNNGMANCVLNLNHTQIATLINTKLSFEQSYILVEAYNYTADWSTVLYEQCIVKNNISYLDSFLQHFSLTDSLVHDVSRKFLNANLNTPNELKCMKNILIKLPSMHTKYRIASELGFVDLVEDLLAGGQLAYLKDTVWKRGYKN